MNERTKTRTIVGTLTDLERMPSSRNGNPRYCARIGGGLYYTALDSDIGYEISQLVGKYVRIEWRYWYNKPTITSIEEVARPEPVVKVEGGLMVELMRDAVVNDWYESAKADSRFLYAMLLEKASTMTAEDVRKAYAEMQSECEGPGKCEDQGCPAHYVGDDFTRGEHDL